MTSCTAAARPAVPPGGANAGCPGGRKTIPPGPNRKDWSGQTKTCPSPPVDGTSGSDLDAVDRFLAAGRWRVSTTAPGRRELAAALSTLRRLGWDVDTTSFAPYAECAYRVAEREVAEAAGERDAQTVERMVVGTVVFEAVFVALHRLAQEHHAVAGSPGDPRDRAVSPSFPHDDTAPGRD